MIAISESVAWRKMFTACPIIDEGMEINEFVEYTTQWWRNYKEGVTFDTTAKDE